MSDILRRLANDSKSGVEVFTTAPPHILAALIDEGLAVVDMSRGRPAMKITEKGREAALLEQSRPRVVSGAR